MEIAKEMLKGKKIAEVIKEWKKAEYVYAFRQSFRRALFSKKEVVGNE